MLLSTDGFSYPFTQIFTANYEAEFKRQGVKTVFIYESLNLYLFSEGKEDYYRSLVSSFQMKYKNRQPDLVMAVEIASAEFLLEYGDSIFDNTRILTAGTSELNHVIHEKNWYQIMDTLDVGQMFATIETLQPETQKVTVIIGCSDYENGIVDWYKSKTKKLSNNFEIEYTQNRSYEELLETVENPEPNEVFYYLYFFEDKTGEKFIPKKVFLELEKVAKAPLYVYFEHFVSGENTVGGYVVSAQNLAKVSAQKSIEILENPDTGFSLFEFASNKYVYNWKGLKKYDIPIETLPANSLILNKEYTVWELYWHYIIASVGFMLLQTGLIILLLQNRTKRKKAESKIVEINRNLEKTVEKQVAKIKSQNDILEINMQKLVDLQKHKEDLTTMIVHDLKNPLNALINMPSSYPPKEKRAMKDYLANKMLLLVMNILDVQKFKEKKVILNRTDEKVFSIVKTAIEQQRYNIKAKNIDIQMDSKTDAIVNIDKELIERVFQNLFSNALKYTPTGGKIEIEITPIENNSIKIAISDNGTGIQQGNLKHIFDKYNHSKNRKQYSTGIGLTFCKIAIEAHGGSIGIDETYTNGAKIWFTLPYSENKIELEKLKPEQIESSNELSLNESEKQSLQKVLPLLKQTKINEVSHLRKILKTIETEQLGNLQWHEALKKAIYTCDSAQYQVLINQIE